MKRNKDTGRCPLCLGAEDGKHIIGFFFFGN
jgi:hypothetical protein